MAETAKRGFEMLLVTGGAGYVGSHFLRRFREHTSNAPIVIVDDLSQGHVESLPEGDKVFFHQLNIGNVAEMCTLLKKYPIQTVVHFAASAYVGESQVDPLKYFENNVINSINLFRAMENSGVKQIVFSSSCATYGNPDYLPIDELHPQRPVNVYGRTKLMIEQTLKSLSETLGWSFVALRYFNAAGASTTGKIGEHHSPETHLIPLLLMVANGTLDSIQINGNDYDTKDGTCIRDYIHVDDLANAHLAAVDYLAKGNQSQFVNLGTSHGSSIREVIEICRQVSKKEIPITEGARRIGDPASLVADYAKALTILDWRPNFDLQTIIETAWKWHLNPRY